MVAQVATNTSQSHRRYQSRHADPDPNYVIVDDVLIIASATTIGKLYQVTATECSCYYLDAG